MQVCGNGIAHVAQGLFHKSVSSHPTSIVTRTFALNPHFGMFPAIGFSAAHFGTALSKNQNWQLTVVSGPLKVLPRFVQSESFTAFLARCYSDFETSRPRKDYSAYTVL